MKRLRAVQPTGWPTPTGYSNGMVGDFPAMALLEVKGLLEEGALVEIEATALLPR